jgi:hypothetical protein
MWGQPLSAVRPGEARQPLRCFLIPQPCSIAATTTQTGKYHNIAKLGGLPNIELI